MGVFKAPLPIDQSIPPIIRGFWQGGETFIIDSVSNKLATEYTPEESKKEISITEVHTILHWINKGSPLLEKTSSPQGDSQYESWEYGVQRWWNLNRYKYQIVTLLDKPTAFDDIHTAESRPILEIIGIQNKAYSKNDNVYLSIDSKGRNPIKKIDIFVNSTYVTSLKSSPYITNFSLGSIDNLSKTNTVRIIGVDTLGNMAEVSASLKINNI